MNMTLEIKNRIMNAKKGTIFITNDFVDVGSFNSCNRVINRLVDEDFLRRIIPGVFDKPYYIKSLEMYNTPSIEKVAGAIARKFKWTIVPNGNVGLNLLGLSEQVPSGFDYMSDGPSKVYHYKNAIIRFQKDTTRDIVNLSQQSSILVQALKVLGDKNIDDKTISKLASILSANEKKKILKETKNVTSWVYDYLKKICK